MGRLRRCIPILALAWLAAACSEQESDVATSPSFAKPPVNGCSASTVSNLVKSEFGASSAESGLATDMKNYGAQTAQATYVGYRLLDVIATKYAIPANQTASRSDASALTVELLKCMNVGASTVPASFETELGTTGAYAVRGWPGDSRTVTSHDGTWVLEPPSGQSWGAITQLATSGLPDTVKGLFLAFGKPGQSTGFTNDLLVGSVFDWSTIPEATFTGAGAVIGECTQPSNYLQHNAATAGAEVLGFVPPSCTVFVSAGEREPRTFAERLIRLLSPQPAFAALATSTGTGGAKSKLSPFGLINPSLVNLNAQFTWKKSGNAVGAPFNPPPKYQIQSKAGTVFQQDFVLLWLEAIGNNGTNVEICNNWAYTNSAGLAQFPAAFLNKAGGYTIIARTTGTRSKPDGELGEAPAVPPGQSNVSPLINVKNGTVGTCANTFKEGDPLPAPPGPNGFAE